MIRRCLLGFVVCFADESGFGYCGLSFCCCLRLRVILRFGWLCIVCSCNVVCLLGYFGGLLICFLILGFVLCLRLWFNWWGAFADLDLIDWLDFLDLIFYDVWLD